MLEPDVESLWRRFEDAARRYCKVIDSVESMASSQSLYIEIAAPLADLFAAGRSLPVVRISDDDFEVESPGHEVWRKAFETINRLTGDEDPYRTVFNPQKDTEAIEAALAVDLADIYVDVLPAIQWEDMEHLNDLLFELRLSFQGNWGQHALEAMKVINWRYPYW